MLGIGKWMGSFLDTEYRVDEEEIARDVAERIDRYKYIKDHQKEVDAERNDALKQNKDFRKVLNLAVDFRCVISELRTGVGPSTRNRLAIEDELLSAAKSQRLQMHRALEVKNAADSFYQSLMERCKEIVVSRTQSAKAIFELETKVLELAVKAQGLVKVIPNIKDDAIKSKAEEGLARVSEKIATLNEQIHEAVAKLPRSIKGAVEGAISVVKRTAKLEVWVKKPIKTMEKAKSAQADFAIAFASATETLLGSEKEKFAAGQEKLTAEIGEMQKELDKLQGKDPFVKELKEVQADRNDKGYSR